MLNEMTEGKPWKLILFFTLPMLAGNIFQQFYNMVDSIVVGRYVGPNALAAVSTCFPIIGVLLSLVFGFMIGSGIIFSQLYGAGKTDEMRRALITSMIFQFFCALLITLLGLLGSESLLRLLQVPAEVFHDALIYARIFFIGFTFMHFYNVFAGVLRSLGDSKTPLIFLVISALVNIVLDVFFVASLGWGVAGVAWATVIAQALSMTLCYLYILRNIPLLTFGLKDLTFDTEILKSMIKLGVPSSIQQVVYSLGIMAVQGLVNSFGAVTMAAYAAASRIDSFATMPINNFSQALTTFCGQNIGGERFDRAKEGVRSTLLLSIAVCVVMSAVVFAFGPYLISIFLDSGNEVNQAVIAQGVDYIKTIAYFYVIFAVLTTINGLLQGAGDTMTPMVTSLLNLAVRIIVAYALSAIPEIGYRGIWLSIPFGWFVGAIVPIYRYLSGKWQAKAREHNESMLKLANEEQSHVS